MSDDRSAPPSILTWMNRLLPIEGGTECAARDISFGSHPRHRLDIYRPKSLARPAPVVFFIYGGGWNSGERSEYAFVGHAYAAAGFVVVIADYRVVPEVQYPGFVDDNARALDWTLANIDQWGGDAARVFLVGHSAGAYNAAMLGLAPKQFDGDWGSAILGVVGLSGPYDFYPFDVRESIEAFSNAPDPAKTQPINLVTKNAPPFYLGHGQKDGTCLPRNSKALAVALRDADIEVVEHYYPHRKHVEPLVSLFRLLRWLTPAYRESVEFMKKHLAD